MVNIQVLSAFIKEIDNNMGKQKRDSSSNANTVYRIMGKDFRFINPIVNIDRHEYVEEDGTESD